MDPELLNQPGMQRRNVLLSSTNNASTATSSAIITNRSTNATILQSAASIVQHSPSITLQNLSTLPTITSIQSPITIPQMTRFVPIAPAPTGVPLVTQITSPNNISSQPLGSPPIQIQIQQSMSNQTAQSANNSILKGSTVLGQPQRITLNTEPIIAQTVGKDGKQMVVGRREQIMLFQPSALTPGGKYIFVYICFRLYVKPGRNFTFQLTLIPSSLF